MIKVYDSNEKIFANNGLKILHPIRADVVKVDNGDYYVEFQDTIENIDYYQNGMIARVPTAWGVQGFRLSNPVVKNNKIECKAWHLSYDAKNYIIVDAYAENKNCNDALAHFNSKTDVASPFTTISNITSLVSTRAIRKSLYDVYEWLISADKYGGHWYRDNWTLGIKSSVGQDRGVVLAVGKNITDIQKAEDWNDVCTKIFPYTTDGESAIVLDEGFISLEEQLYDIPYTKVIKFENELEKESFETDEGFKAATKEWLKRQGESYLDEHKMPKVNYSVASSITNISDVGDVIQVKHPQCKINILTNVISITYDAIKGKYTKIEFGNFKKELKNLSQNITAEVNKNTESAINNTKVLLQSELEEATAKINGVLGNSYVIYDGDKILVVDALPKETAKNVLKISNGGIGFSNTGINGTFSSAWTIDGILDMKNINVINLTASLIKGGVLKLGGTNDSSGTFELYDASNRLMALMDRTGLTVYATNGDYVKLNAEVGFAGYNKSDTKIYWADGDVFHMKKAEVEDEIAIAKKVRVVPVNTTDAVGVGFVGISKGGE